MEEASNMYLGILRGTEEENVREERVYRHTVDDAMIREIFVRNRVFYLRSLLGFHK